jgi:hypothetical protein
MDVSHDHTDFGAQIPFLGTKIYFFLLHVKFSIVSHDHTDFKTQIPFEGTLI